MSNSLPNEIKLSCLTLGKTERPSILCEIHRKKFKTSRGILYHLTTEHPNEISKVEYAKIRRACKNLENSFYNGEKKK